VSGLELTVDVITVTDLAKTYRTPFRRRRVDALRGVSFAVARGEVFGFLGPNGAGKTTTIRCLMGLCAITAGKAEILGAPVPSRAARQRMGFLPEQPYFYDYLTVSELLDLGGRLFGLDRSRAPAPRRSADRPGRPRSRGRGLPLKKYSKGMLQRAGLALALINDPELVILDEPMSGLDPVGRKEVRDLILEERDAGKTVFFSSHILSDVESLCDRVAICVGGQDQATSASRATWSTRPPSTTEVTAGPGRRRAGRGGGGDRGPGRVVASDPGRAAPGGRGRRRRRRPPGPGPRPRRAGPRGDPAPRDPRGSVPAAGGRGRRRRRRRGDGMTASLGRIWAVALNAFREAVRNRVLYGVVALVLIFNLMAVVVGALSITEQARVARDLGLAGTSIGGGLTAIVIGVSLLYTEVQKRTIYAIISKPLARWEFVVGKYLGMALVLTVLVGLFTLAMVAMLSYRGVAVAGAVGQAVVLTWCEVLVVAAIAVFFSSFSSPFLSGLFALALWLIGRLTPDLRAAVATSEAGWIDAVSSATLAVVPDLHLFSVSGRAVDGHHVSVNGDFVGWGYVSTAAVHGALWIAGLLVLASLIFRRRDFV
jgi:ABC-type multidrug transport system ATPase subunit/ABC-type transport system involved in multi-copper enzyme maturation permease subunit